MVPIVATPSERLTPVTGVAANAGLEGRIRGALLFK